MAAAEQTNQDEESADKMECKAKQDRGEYYDDWGKYAKAEDEAANAKDKAEDDERREKQILANLPARGSSLGYEFRKGAKTLFPEIVLADGEGDDEAAWRVACERREFGTASFRDGTVWGAQTAVDTWGQGLLCLTRIRNLRKGRVKVAADAAKKALAEGANTSASIGAPPGAEDVVDFSSPEAWEAMGWTGSVAKPTEEPLREDVVSAIGKAVEALKAAQAGPTDQEVESQVCTLQMNIAQGLLKLGQWEAAVGHCDAAIAIDPTNVKALWRKAKAVWGTRNPGLAREALDALLQVDAKNAAALTMLSEIEVEEAKKRKRRTGLPNTKPTFRFPTSSPSGEADGTYEAEEEGNDEAVVDSLAESADVDAEDAPLLPAAEACAPVPTAPWWFCCRRKRKTE